MSLEKKEERIRDLERTLRQIAMLGGNLDDERLTGRTGPNDAQARGLMYTEARRLALTALDTSLKNLWS